MASQLRFVVDFVSPALAQQRGSVQLARVSGRLVVESAFANGSPFEHALKFTARISAAGNPHLGMCGFWGTKNGERAWIDAHLPVNAETRQWLTRQVFANPMVRELAAPYLRGARTAPVAVAAPPVAQATGTEDEIPF